MQVSKLPDIEVICLALGGLVWPKQGSINASQEAALQFKKKIARYALLSWTMCLGRVSINRLSREFRTAEDFIEKGLLTKAEATILKVIFLSIKGRVKKIEISMKLECPIPSFSTQTL